MVRLAPVQPQPGDTCEDCGNVPYEGTRIVVRCLAEHAARILMRRR